MGSTEGQHAVLGGVRVSLAVLGEQLVVSKCGYTCPLAVQRRWVLSLTGCNSGDIRRFAEEVSCQSLMSLVRPTVNGNK